MIAFFATFGSLVLFIYFFFIFPFSEREENVPHDIKKYKPHVNTAFPNIEKSDLVQKSEDLLAEFDKKLGIEEEVELDFYSVKKELKEKWVDAIRKATCSGDISWKNSEIFDINAFVLKLDLHKTYIRKMYHSEVNLEGYGYCDLVFVIWDRKRSNKKELFVINEDNEITSFTEISSQYSTPEYRMLSDLHSFYIKKSANNELTATKMHQMAKALAKV